MTAVDDLAAWLTQIYDEDEADNTLVRPATTFSTSDHWKGAHLTDCGSLDRDGYGDRTGDCDCGEPARRLARIAADRQILAAYEKAVEDSRPSGSPTLWGKEARFGLYTAVLLLASAYADRPGYREEWKP